MGGGDSPARGADAEISMSIEETNKLRASLGLKPLSVGGAAASTGSGSGARDGADILREEELARGRARERERELAEGRARADEERARRLLGAPGLGEPAGSSDGGDVEAFLARSRRGAAAGPDTARPEPGAAGALAAAPSGARVRAGVRDLAAGETVILTLEDRGLLNERGELADEDDEGGGAPVLENALVRERRDRERARRAAGLAKPLWQEDGERRAMLDKYDEEEEELLTLGDGGRLEVGRGFLSGAGAAAEEGPEAAKAWAEGLEEEEVLGIGAGLPGRRAAPRAPGPGPPRPSLPAPAARPTGGTGGGFAPAAPPAGARPGAPRRRRGRRATGVAAAELAELEAAGAGSGPGEPPAPAPPDLDELAAPAPVPAASRDHASRSERRARLLRRRASETAEDARRDANWEGAMEGARERARRLEAGGAGPGGEGGAPGPAPEPAVGPHGAEGRPGPAAGPGTGPGAPPAPEAHRAFSRLAVEPAAHAWRGVGSSALSGDDEDEDGDGDGGGVGPPIGGGDEGSDAEGLAATLAASGRAAAARRRAASADDELEASIARRRAEAKVRDRGPRAGAGLVLDETGEIARLIRVDLDASRAAAALASTAPQDEPGAARARGGPEAEGATPEAGEGEGEGKGKGPARGAGEREGEGEGPARGAGAVEAALGGVEVEAAEATAAAADPGAAAGGRKRRRSRWGEGGGDDEAGPPGTASAAPAAPTVATVAPAGSPAGWDSWAPADEDPEAAARRERARAARRRRQGSARAEGERVGARDGGDGVDAGDAPLVVDREVGGAASGGRARPAPPPTGGSGPGAGSAAPSRSFGAGLAGTLARLHESGELSRSIEWSGRANEVKAGAVAGLEGVYDAAGPGGRYERSVAASLTRKDEYGRVLAPKEQWRQLNYAFHGIKPSKNAIDKRRRQADAEVRARTQAAGGAEAAAAAAAAAASSSSRPFVVLEGTVAPGQTRSALGGLSSRDDDL